MLPARTRGFTLLEMLVVLAIIGVVMTIVLTNQGSFNRSFILANTAYDVALTLRSAETYGLGSRVTGSTANVGYGLDFSIATPDSFLFFGDTYPAPNANNCHGLPPAAAGGASSPSAEPGNCIYDVGEDTLVASYTIGNSITVSNFCVEQLSGWQCARPSGSVTSGTFSRLDIVFSRPNAEPLISTDGIYPSTDNYTAACLTLASPQDTYRYVTVEASGEITADATSCP